MDRLPARLINNKEGGISLALGISKGWRTYIYEQEIKKKTTGKYDNAYQTYLNLKK